MPSYKKCYCFEGSKIKCDGCSRKWFLAKAAVKTHGNRIPIYFTRQEIDDVCSALGQVIRIETNVSDPGRYGYLTAVRSLDKRVWKVIRELPKSEG